MFVQACKPFVQMLASLMQVLSCKHSQRNANALSSNLQALQGLDARIDKPGAQASASLASVCKDSLQGLASRACARSRRTITSNSGRDTLRVEKPVLDSYSGRDTNRVSYRSLGVNARASLKVRRPREASVLTASANAWPRLDVIQRGSYMGKVTGIEWCRATWSPWWGCVKVSPGCEHCYMGVQTKRYGHNVWGPAKTTTRKFMSDSHWREPLKWDAEAAAAGERWRVFPSMCDPFEHNDLLRDERWRFWRLIEQTPNLDWLLLTKRPENIRWMLPTPWLYEPQQNVWLGTSVENQDYAKRVDTLRSIPAVVRFVSYEPALGYVKFDYEGIDWMIVGGESGAGARPFNVDWAWRTVVDCRFAGAAPFVKQLGSRPVTTTGKPLKLKSYKGDDMSEWADELRVREYPRRAVDSREAIEAHAG